jgi:hypothetical protein
LATPSAFQFSRTIVRGAEATGINSGWKKPAKQLYSGQPNEHAMIFPQQTIASTPPCLLDVPAFWSGNRNRLQERIADFGNGARCFVTIVVDFLGFVASSCLAVRNTGPYIRPITAVFAANIPQTIPLGAVA